MQKRQEEIEAFRSQLSHLSSGVSSQCQDLKAFQASQLDNTVSWLGRLQTDTTTQKVLVLFCLVSYNNNPDCWIFCLQ